MQSQGAKHLGRLHDVIFLYSMSDEYTLNTVYTPYSQEYIDNFFRYSDDDGRRYRLVSMIGTGGAAKGNPFYDLYLLDIQLGQMTGMELAEKIREKDDHAVILFATNYKEMIRKAFQVSALDYLVKPLDEVEVRQALLRSFRYLSKKRNRIALKNQSGVEIFYHEEIEYIESEKRKVRIYSRRGSGEFYVRLNDLEHEFKGSLLVRVHASFIINLEKIRSVRKDTITMESGKEIPVTRKYKDQFNRAFQNYCLEMRR